ncbi:MAG: sulfate adenylyltransferase, partial [candidate division WS1 bacterium]|nr:sulfate adenylyltransferase [candidate division WS1 bacterium]
SFSGTEIRSLIQSRSKVPEQVMRPEVLERILQFDDIFVD